MPWATMALVCCKDDQVRLFRGSKSRNKVSVGEPAEGSLQCANRTGEFRDKADSADGAGSWSTFACTLQSDGVPVSVSRQGEA